MQTLECGKNRNNNRNVVTGIEVMRTLLKNAACVGKMLALIFIKKENRINYLELYRNIYFKILRLLCTGRTVSTTADEPHGCLLMCLFFSSLSGCFDLYFFIHHLPDAGLPITLFCLCLTVYEHV